MEESSLPKTELLSGYLTIIMVVFGFVCFSTFMIIDEGIENLNGSILLFAENQFKNLVYLTSSILFLVSLVGISALYYLVFRFFNPVMGSFIAFGFFAAAVSIIISSSAALSFHQLLQDYLVSTNYQSDMVAINMVSVQQLKLKSLMIGATFFGLSMLLMSILGYSAHIFHILFSIITGISGGFLVVVIWFISSDLLTKTAVILAGVSLIAAGIHLIKHSKKRGK